MRQDTRGFSRGRKAASLLFKMVAVSIATMDGMTIAVANALDSGSPGSDVKVATGADGYSPHVCSCRFPLWHHCDDQISRGKTLHLLELLGRGSRKAKFVHAAHLSRAMPLSGNDQRMHRLHLQGRWSAPSDVRRIQPMR